MIVQRFNATTEIEGEARDAQRGWPVRLSGAQRQDVARIAVDALDVAGLVVVSAEDLRVYVTEEMPDFVTYVTAQARLRAALPERKRP